MILPVALIKPPVDKLPPVTLPLALITPVMFNPAVVNVKILVVPATLPMIFPPEAGIFISLVPLSNLLAAPTLPDAITPVKPAPLPVKNAAVTLPVALTCPAVNTLPAVTLPVAVTSPAVLMSPPTMLPVTVAATILPFRLNWPAVNKLVTEALLAEVFAFAVIFSADTSVRLRINPVLVICPVALRLLNVENPVTFSMPEEYTPVLDTVKTLAMLPDEITTFPFACGMFTLLVPLATPLIPLVAKS